MFQKIGKKELLIFLLLVLFGVILVFPHVLFSFDNNYQGIFVSRVGDEDHSMAKVKDVIDGYWDYASSYIWEYKNFSKPILQYSELILGIIGLILAMKVSTLFILIKFAGPFVVGVIIYWFSRSLKFTAASSLLLISLILLGEKLINLEFLKIFNVLFYQDGYREFLAYTRVPNPAFTGIFFFLVIFLFFRWFQKRDRNSLLILALSFGILFYIYAYFWSFAVVLIGLVGLYFVASKEWKNLKELVFGALLGTILGLPFFFLLFKYWPQNQGKSFIVESHAFVFDKIVIVALIIYIAFLIYLFYKKAFKKRYLFPLFLLLSAFIVSNQQVITGMEIQVHHYYEFTNKPCVFIALICVWDYFLKQIKHRKALLINSFTIGIVCLFAIGVQISSLYYWKADFVYYQNYQTFFKWLNNNSLKDSVVYSNDIISEFIPVYTHNNVYWAPHSVEYVLVPIERNIHNYFSLIRINGVEPEEVKEYFYNNRGEVGKLVHGCQYWKNSCGTCTCMPNKVLDDLVNEYTESYDTTISEYLKKYRLDYILWDKNKNPGWDLTGVDVESVFSQNNIVLYQVK